MYQRTITELIQLGGYVFGAGHAVASPRDLLALTALTALTAVALVGLAVALLAHGGTAPVAGPLTARVAALRDKAWSAAYQRQLDPSAAGRPRPRAPSAAPAAA